MEAHGSSHTVCVRRSEHLLNLEIGPSKTQRLAQPREKFAPWVDHEQENGWIRSRHSIPPTTCWHSFTQSWRTSSNVYIRSHKRQPRTVTSEAALGRDAPVADAEMLSPSAECLVPNSRNLESFLEVTMSFCA